MTIIQNFFRNTSKILKSELERSSEISHSGLKGQNREIFIQNFLTKAFPKKFVIGTGEIIDSKDKKSKQADIVIYDEFLPIFDYGSTKHFLSGGVLAHIEVKSNLTSGELSKSLGITKSVKSLNRDLDVTANSGSLPRSIFSCLFAYEGLSKEKFKEKILDIYKDEKMIDNQIDAVCVLNKYVMIKIYDKKEKVLKVEFLETNEDSLMVFSTRLFGGMYKSWIGVPNLYQYLGDLNFKRF
ncbi:hypothetical protein HYW21_05630 [Candidatus Woesearchaeota archaeon]|nr:hypothetical protein [Candidatus Woesearchaeota archaeon]